MLRQYDTLIIDEAHERSLNIDFILGYLTQLLPRRPDLKVVITSATIDPERFAAHFERHAGRSSRCPGRTLPGRGPLPARRRPRRPGRRPATATRSTRSATPWPSCSARAPATSWCSCPASARSATPPTRWPSATCRNTEILPLYARLSTAEQHRVFAAASRAPGRAGHQRRRDVADRAGHPLRRRPRHRAHLPLLPPAQGAAAADRGDLARPAPTSAPGAAAASPTASASGSTPRTTSTRAPSSPSRRSCAPTWPRSSCR